jgi:shikimate dehydrogenase
MTQAPDRAAATAQVRTQSECDIPMRIDGATRLYAIVGDPIVLVRSPAVYTEAFARATVNAVLVPAHVARAHFEESMRGLMALANLDGLLITSPYKADARCLADRLSERARMVGAVNALRREDDARWSGDMFDGVGFVAAAKRRSPLKGKRALLFGCGGAGAAIAVELAQEGVDSLALVDPDVARAERLREIIARGFPNCAASVGHDGDMKDVIVNASTVGMRDPDALPGELGSLGPQTIVGDVVLRPPHSPTALVRRAMAAGSCVVTGEDMHRGQRDAILEFFAPRSRCI